jgi:ABC-type lipoprotein release transport system permease subunit
MSRRRREIGLVKALGSVNGQVGAAVCGQATTVATVGVLLGIPSGIVTGQAIWRALATDPGAAPVAVVPTRLAAAWAVGVLVVAHLLAIAPALAAARSKTTSLLSRNQ